MKRGALKIPVGNLYATPGLFLNKDGSIDEKAFKSRGMAFNRYQRGHQHSLELSTDFATMFILAAFVDPMSAAYAGALYAAGTLLYGLAYPINPKLRVVGELLYIPGMFWLAYICGSAGYKLISK